ncbi:MAG: flagellar biosynthetic protein FliR [Pseudomonadota bacterium]
MPAGFLTPTIFGFLMVLFRATALCSVAPLYGMKTVPARVRMGLSIVLAYAAFAGAGFPMFSGNAGALITGALVETIVGLSAGMACRFALEAAGAAGQIIAGSIGLSYGSTLDPLHGTESTSIGELMSLVAMGAMLGAGVHRELVVWLCKSVVSLPPGAPIDIGPLAGVVVTQALGAVALAVRMAFPVMAAVTFGHVALGVVGRTAPQLNISSVGFSITILAGGGALYMTLPTIAEMAALAARQALGAG